MILSEVESQVLQLMANGFTIKSACKKIGAHRTQVYRHIFETKRKYNLKSTPQMMAEAFRNGIIK